MAPPLIRKSSGQLEPYSKHKLYQSLRRAGVAKAPAEEVVRVVTPQIGERASSRWLHDRVADALHGQSPEFAARYRLGVAVFELGPDGHHFEKFVAALLAEQGYHTELGITLAGRCVSHEVDIVAMRGEERRYVECKHRSSPLHTCDVKIPLYIQARHLDLAEAPNARSHDFWLVTNARFTGDAIRYAECVGLKLWGWDHPHGHGLREASRRYGVYPITCLTTPSPDTVRRLLSRYITLCRDLLDRPEAWDEAGCPPSEQEATFEEAKQVCRRQEIETTEDE